MAIVDCVDNIDVVDGGCVGVVSGDGDGVSSWGVVCVTASTVEVTGMKTTDCSIVSHKNIKKLAIVRLGAWGWAVDVLAFRRSGSGSSWAAVCVNASTEGVAVVWVLGTQHPAPWSSILKSSISIICHTAAALPRSLPSFNPLS